MRAAFIVFIGSGLGGVLRHLVGLLALRLLGPGFPYGTLAINVAGSALMDWSPGCSHRVCSRITGCGCCSPPG